MSFINSVLKYLHNHNNYNVLNVLTYIQARQLTRGLRGTVD